MEKAISQSQIEASMESDMSALVKTMRFMLANLKEEQQAIMLKNSESLSGLLKNRHGILEDIRFYRSGMLSKISELRQLSGVSFNNGSPLEEEDLTALFQQLGSDNVLVLSLKDQILALAEAIDKQNGRNKLLLDHGKNLILKPCPWFKPTPKAVIQTLEDQDHI